MRLRNCLGVACLLLALSVGLFLNGVSFKENTSLKMNANSYDRVQLAGADEVTANFGQDFVNPMGISLLDLETFHDLNDYLVQHLIKAGQADCIPTTLSDKLPKAWKHMAKL